VKIVLKFQYLPHQRSSVSYVVGPSVNWLPNGSALPTDKISKQVAEREWPWVDERDLLGLMKYSIINFV
jgi:hypothetical protein